MKILYAIQGTGNGHVSRAREIIPLLKKYGDVDIVLSGTHTEVNLGHHIKYRFHGVGFIFGQKGKIDVWRTLKDIRFWEFLKNVKQLPVRDYDLVIQDVEPITAWACKLKGKSCWEMSHQISLNSGKTPKIKGFHFGHVFLKFYTPRKHKVGFHFKKYDDFIHTAVIRNEVRKLESTNENFYLVYLPAFGDAYLKKLFHQFPEHQFVVFSKHTQTSYNDKNVKFLLIDNEGYLQHLAKCSGLICGAGFEGPSEALFLKKKLICVPMQNQYEQLCNAQALEDLGVPIIWKNKSFYLKLKNWLVHNNTMTLDFPDETEEIVRQIVLRA